MHEPDEAATVLKLPEGADATQARDRFIAARADLEKKIAEALTPGLQERYRRVLAVTTEAYETLVLAAEGGAIGEPPAAPASRPQTQAAGMPPTPSPSFGRRLGWHLKGMVRGAFASLFGAFCLFNYYSATEATFLEVPGIDDDYWLTGLAGLMGFVIWPGIFLWLGSVRASARLPVDKGRAVYVVAGFIAAFVASSAIQSHDAPAKALAAARARELASASVAPSPAVVPEPVAPAAPVASEPSADVIALRGHRLVMGSDGVVADVEKGLVMYREAAGKGSILAMTYLEEAYTEGKVVAADAAEAGQWRARKQSAQIQEWEGAAGKGDVQAANELAYAYSAGEGVPLDRAKAVALWRQAAAGNVAPAMYKLGEAYAEGEGVEKDPVLAREWLRKAAALDLKLAEQKLAAMDEAEQAKARADAVARAAVAAAEARLARMANGGKLVSLARVLPAGMVGGYRLRPVTPCCSPPRSISACRSCESRSVNAM